MHPNNPQEFEDSKLLVRINDYLNSKELLPEQKQDLKGFKLEYCEQRKQKPATIDSYLRYLLFLGRHYKKDYRKITKDELVAFFDANKDKKESWHDWARLSIKLFYRWLLSEKQEDKTRRGAPFPEIVSWIKITRGKLRKISKSECLNASDMKKMLGACRNQRDRALIYVLYDSGARITEMLCVQIKHVHLDTDEVYIEIPISKTDKGENREIYLIDSIHELTSWLSMHPDKNDASAFLFPNLNKGVKREFMDRKTALIIIQDIAKRAKINKRVYNHLFRHSAATFDRTNDGMPDQYMNDKFGWSENSKMINRYASIKSSDVGKFQKRARGKPVKIESEKAPKECPRCKTENTFDAEFCKKCATPMNAQLKYSMQDKVKTMQTQLEAVLEEQKRMKKEMEQMAATAAHESVGRGKLIREAQPLMKKTVGKARAAKPGDRA